MIRSFGCVNTLSRSSSRFFVERLAQRCDQRRRRGEHLAEPEPARLEAQCDAGWPEEERLRTLGDEAHLATRLAQGVSVMSAPRASVGAADTGGRAARVSLRGKRAGVKGVPAHVVRSV